MKPLPFEYNDNNMSFNYIRTREGPNQFVCYYKHQAVLRQDPKDAWRVLGVAKFTDTGKELKAWCLEMDEKYGGHSEELDMNQVKSEGFGPEAHEEPNDNTKMVT
jgi:hypothetical protein